LLNDDALQEQLKLLAQQGTDNARAVAPSSASDMAQKIEQDFILNPMRKTREALPASTALTQPPAEQQSPARQALGRAALDFISPRGGMLAEGGILGRLGALTPEVAEAEQQERVQQAEQGEQAARAAESAREQLRNLTDDQAASLGLPVA